MNHNLIQKFINVLKVNKIKPNYLVKKISSVQKIFLKKSNITVVPKNKETLHFLNKENISNAIKIKHNRKPYDFGLMDGHWNENGRKNIIDSIIPFINNKLLINQ